VCVGFETALAFASAVVLSWVSIVCCVGPIFNVEQSLCCSVVKEDAELLLTLSNDFCGGEDVYSVKEFLRQGRGQWCMLCGG
jgi:hypothetical protein